MALTLLFALPHYRRFFLSERWGGYAESRRAIDRWHNPVAAPLALAIWMACGVALTIGQMVVAAALVNVVLCRYYFVHMRWQGLLRGMGAPGFMAYWLGVMVLLLEYTSRHAPQLQPLALLVAQVDFAWIMLSAGIYKWSAGYAHGDGMDFGMVNPMWGYWWRLFLRVPPGHLLYRFLNHMAWVTEVVAAVLMLVPHPGTRATGGLLMTLSFLFIGSQIRLAWLTEIVMLCGLLLVPPGHLVDRAIGAVFPAATPVVSAGPQLLNGAVAVVLWAYLVLIPVAHAGLFYNFYARRRLGGVCQTALETYTNVFGLIIWRVFSVDHLNFFIRVLRESPDGVRTLISRYGAPGALRYCHVAECIVITTLFTTLKYHASNQALFDRRLLRYVKTLDARPGDRIVFEYVSVRKMASAWAHVPVAEYIVDPASQTIREAIRESGFDVHAAAPTSPVHEGARPGSYAPAR